MYLRIIVILLLDLLSLSRNNPSSFKLFVVKLYCFQPVNILTILLGTSGRPPLPPLITGLKHNILGSA